MTLCAVFYGCFLGHAGIELKDPAAYEKKLRAGSQPNARVVVLEECPVCNEPHLPPFDGSCLLS